MSSYRRSICTRATLFIRRFPNISNPFYSHPNNHDTTKPEYPIQTPSFSSYFNKSSLGPTQQFHHHLHHLHRHLNHSFIGLGALHLSRNMSTSISGGSDKAEILSDVAGIITDTPADVIASQAPLLSEVAVAAADSAYPVAALQYLIDGVHTFTGFNWWASIALTTLLIRAITVPFLINQLKSTSKLSIMRPRLEEIKEEMDARAMDPQAVYDGKQKMNALFKEYGVTPFTPMKGIFIQGPVFISFFFAITNMTEKVPSFKSGGAFWFTDLTVPDSMYILPVLTGLTFLMNVEFNVQEGLEGNPVAGTMKKFSRGLAVLSVPFTMNFPQAIFCYWVTSNIFSFAYGSVLKIRGVKKALNIPEIPIPPPSKQKPQSSYSFLDSLKKVAAASKVAASEHAQNQQKDADPKASSSAVLRQQLKTLERQVKHKKKNKKQP